MKNLVIFLFAGLATSSIPDDAVSAPAYLDEALGAIPEGETRRVEAAGRLIRINYGPKGRDLFVFTAGDHRLPVLGNGGLDIKDIEKYWGLSVQGEFEIGRFPLKDEPRSQLQGHWVTGFKIAEVLEPPHSAGYEIRYDITTYRGNGRLIDHGPPCAWERLDLELGDVDFSEEAEITYKMEGLPPVGGPGYTIGFMLKDMPRKFGWPKDDKDMGKEFNRAKVSIRLKSEDGSVVWNVEKDFADWTWSPRDDRRFVHLPNDPGKGGDSSRFDPEAGEGYELVVKISPLPGSKGVKQAELRLTGGGWGSKER